MVSLRRTPRPCGSGSLNAVRRAAELELLADGETVDVLVVGGGITGTWVALDAASRGLSVALVERGDLAQGTSRWSSKLAHGGLRYLAQGEVGLAWESARERAVLMDVNAPHLVHALPMLFPLGPELGRAGGMKIEAGLRIGDRLRAAAGTSRRRLPPVRRISAAEACRLAPELSDRDLRGALMHWDGQIEDDARLVVAVARTAASYGARILTYANVTALGSDGATLRNERKQATFDVRARHVVNAAGVWAGELSGGIELRPSKGSHLLIPAVRLGNPRAAFTVPVKGDGGSHYVFAVPRPDDLVLIGITDTPFDGPIPDEPTVDADEERFLLDSISRVLERPLAPADVVGRYAGFRPLLADGDAATADLSRRHAVIEQDGVLTIVGGKLTTARRMAQDAVDRIAARPGVRAGACATMRLPLVGAVTGTGVSAGSQRGAGGLPARLVRRYGAEAARVAALANGTSGSELLEPIAPEVPVTRAELRFAIEHELALTPADLLDRRTRLGLVPAWRAAALGAADELLGDVRDPAS
jgi:glycerol-3-phosphate dehydrogenase